MQSEISSLPAKGVRRALKINMGIHYEKEELVEMIGKEENPKGDRVIINLNGKFLPYKSW